MASLGIFFIGQTITRMLVLKLRWKIRFIL